MPHGPLQCAVRRNLPGTGLTPPPHQQPNDDEAYYGGDDLNYPLRRAKPWEAFCVVHLELLTFSDGSNGGVFERWPIGILEIVHK
jgi:hypothetical protein